MGAYWTYEISPDIPLDARIHPTVKVESIVYRGDTKYYHYDTAGRYWNCWDGEGLQENISPPDSLEEIVVGGWKNWYFKYPTEEGESWEGFGYGGPYDIGCIAADVSVTVPYGTIDHCFVYRSLHSGQYVEDVWIQPAIGIVKRHMVFRDSDLVVDVKLVDYAL